jgi:hypothetical protein
MGVDFIKKAKDKWRKGWSRERQKLSIAELYSGSPNRAQALDVVAFKTSEFREGEPYEVRVEEGRLFVYKKGQSIGVCTTPPWNVLRQVAASGGKTLGAFRKAGENEGHVEVMVLLPELPAVRSAVSGNIQSK